MTRIRFGLRRYPALMALFVGTAVGFLVWRDRILTPTYIFPFGTQEPAVAKPILLAVAVLALAYSALVSWVRFVRRPEVVIDGEAITLPLGEFGLESLKLGRGEVASVSEERRAGGWRVARVRHRGGELTVAASMLPDEASFDAVRDKLEELAPPNAGGEAKRPKRGRVKR